MLVQNGRDELRVEAQKEDWASQEEKLATEQRTALQLLDEFEPDCKRLRST